MAEAQPKPAGEMEQLVKLLNGRWDMAVTYEPGEMAAQGFTGTGREVSRPGPGGFSVLVESTSSSPAGTFEGFGMIHWSAREQAYTLHWFTNAAPVPAMFTGKWKGADLVFVGTETMMGKELASRHSITNIRPGSFDYAIDMGPTAAALKRFITIHYTSADSNDTRH